MALMTEATATSETVDNLTPEAAQQKLAEVVADGKPEASTADVLSQAEADANLKRLIEYRNKELNRHRAFLENYLKENKLVFYQIRHESQFGVQYENRLEWTAQN